MASREEMILAVKAVQNQFLTQDLVQQCMDIQRTLAERGKEISLIRIFEKKKLLDKHQLHFLQTGEGVSLDLSTPQGRKAIEGYLISRKIGQGGMATVYQARTSELRDLAALKILFPHHYGNKRFVEGFLNEAKLMYELQHENLVQGSDYGQSSGYYYMALEHVDGPSVQDMIDEEGRLSEEMALHVILQVARCLEYLGSKGITHRDIKPDNMLMTSSGQIKLCDLGFAKGADSAGEGEEGITCGTVQYISPEQARGRSDVDIRSDIYSMGATLYHLVIGEVPFSGADGMEVMAKQVLEGLSSDKTKSGMISHHMHYFIEKMMAKEREIRYQSPRELIEDLEAVVEGHQALQFEPDSVKKTLFSGEEPERERSGIRRSGRREGGRRQSRVDGKRAETRRREGRARSETSRRSSRRSQGRTSRLRLRRKDKE